MTAFVEVVKTCRNKIKALLKRNSKEKTEQVAVGMDPFIQKLTHNGFEVTNFLTKQKVLTIADSSKKKNASTEAMNAYIYLAIDVQVVNVNQVKETFELPNKMKQLPDVFFKNFRLRAKGKEVYLERFINNQVTVGDLLKQIKNGDSKTIELVKNHNKGELTTDEATLEAVLKKYLETFNEEFPLGKMYAKNKEFHTELFALYEMSCN